MKIHRPLVVASLATAAALYPAAAHANVVWPGLVVGWVTLVWAVPAGLLIEYFAIQKYLLANDAGRAVLLANLASALAGIVLFPLLGSLAEIVPQSVIRPGPDAPLPHTASYQILMLIGLLPLAALASTLIEGFVLARTFGLDLSGRTFKILFAANFASTAVACLMAAVFLR